jgi:hypothetical protein
MYILISLLDAFARDKEDKLHNSAKSNSNCTNGMYQSKLGNDYSTQLFIIGTSKNQIKSYNRIKVKLIIM